MYTLSDIATIIIHMYYKDTIILLIDIYFIYIFLIFVIIFYVLKYNYISNKTLIILHLFQESSQEARLI